LRLSREPVRGTEKSKLMKAFVVASQADSIEGQSWTEWLFWDHRYWLRIKLGPSENADDYAVRAYTEADVVSAYTRLRKVSWKAMESFKILLESAATGKTKFTLPVITKAGLVICFPTLNIILPDAAGHNWGENYLPGILWQIRYKSQAPLLRLACLRNGINLSNAGGLARKHEGLSRDAGWESIPDP
jgi:hypothetical protein